MPWHQAVGRFHFHAVGDGLFYSGEISANGRVFKLVYDCGRLRCRKCREAAVKNRCNRKIETCVDNVRRKVGACIDLLVVSHLHEDHTNYLPHLLRDNHVETAVLPYLYPWQRLLLALLPEEPSDEYLRFIVQPYRYLRGLGVEHVVALTDSNPPDPQGDWRDVLNETYDPEKKYPRYGKEDWQVRRQVQFLGEDTHGITFQRSDPNGLTVGDLRWEFIFYNHRVEETTELRNFRERVEREFGELTAPRLAEILGSRDELRRLAGFYKRELEPLMAREDINNSSVVLYHGPVLQCRRALTKKKCGTLLTGDILLQDNARNICAYYRARMDRVSVLALPHHGSAHNWTADILEGIKKPCACVASTHTGYDNRMTFPMLHDILIQGMTPQIVSQEHPMKYTVRAYTASASTAWEQ